MPAAHKNFYGYFMQFADGIRIALTVQSVNDALSYMKEDINENHPPQLGNGFGGITLAYNV